MPKDFFAMGFFLGHGAGAQARRLLREYDLLEEALAYHANRHAWMGRMHFGVHLRLPSDDPRLLALVARLRTMGQDVSVRHDREYTGAELDDASWLLLGIATAGLLGGADFGQQYNFADACARCGAGAKPEPPLIAQLGKMGKKPLDQLVFEEHLIATRTIAEALSDSGITGFFPTPVRPPRGQVAKRFVWLRIESELPPMSQKTEGVIADPSCPTCRRSGYGVTGAPPFAPRYDALRDDLPDFNLSYEYFGEAMQQRTMRPHRPVGGGRVAILSQRARRALIAARVSRLVWTPVIVA